MSLMSQSTPGESEKDNSLSIPEILADFFLKKFNMPSYSDDSDNKHKSKRKKSKHKRRRHKKSKHRHDSNSSDSLSRSPDMNSKAVVEDVSSSEEMGIQRLKKIKNMKLQSVNKNAVHAVSLPNDLESKDKSGQSNSSNSKKLEFYGPSLDIVLSSVEPISSSTVNDIANVSSKDIKNIDLVECHLNTNENPSKSNTTLNLTKQISCMTPDLSIPLPVNNYEIQPKGIHNGLVCDRNKDVNDLISDVNKSDMLAKKPCEIQKDPVDGKNNLKEECKNSDKSSVKQNNSHPVAKHISVDKGKKHSRSRSKSKSRSRYNSPSSKHKKRTSRSSSRDSHHSHRKRKKHSRSRSRERLKSRENRRSRSRSHSKSKYSKSKKSSRSRSQSPSDRHTRRRSRSKKSKSRSRSRQHGRSRSKSKQHGKSRSRSRQRGRSRSRQRGRSRSRSRQHGKSRSRSRQRGRSRSRSRQHGRSRRRSQSRRRRSYSRNRDRSSSKSRYKSKSSRRSSSRSRSRSRSKRKQSSHSRKKSHSRSASKERRSSQQSTKFDQAKILETAKRNVLKMMQDGTLPEGLSVENLKKEQLISNQSGGKSVQELTDFCQRLSQQENDPDGSDTEKDNPDDQTGFIHHPFKVKEAAVIKLNIKNAVQLPIKTHAQKVAETARLSSQFPVSSGNQHKQKELEWIPVVPTTSKSETKPAKTNAPTNSDSNKSVEATSKTPVLSAPPAVSSISKPVSHVSPPSEAPKCEAPVVVQPLAPPPPPPLLPTPPTLSIQPTLYQMPMPAIMPSYMMHSQEMTYSYSSSTTMVIPSASVFKPPKKLDIPAIVTKRFQALTKLQQDPNDPDALKVMRDAQETIQEWVESQQVPGLFTGSTDAKMLTAAELCGPKYHKFRKDILSHAPPVTEGKGMSLLKKMGWNPGEGLGKNKEGSLEPLIVDIKMDKKGLVSEGENSKKGASSFTKELQGKHPVSALMELCSKRRWKPPLYSCVYDHGPPHRKLFCFKVEVNGVEYQPVNPCSNKKVAKADAAVLCLQSLNILSKNL